MVAAYVTSATFPLILPLDKRFRPILFNCHAVLGGMVFYTRTQFRYEFIFHLRISQWLVEQGKQCVFRVLPAHFRHRAQTHFRIRRKS
jgi:hypothetical protein